MAREFLTVVVPLVLPTLVYLAWLRLMRWSDTLSWRAVPWLWLAGAGTALLAVVLFTVTVHFGDSERGTYIPPHMENGRIVQGHIDPAAKR